MTQPLPDASPKEVTTFCQAVLDGIDAGVCVTDADMRFVLANPAACRIYGRPRSALIGQSFTIVVEPSQRRKAEDAHRAFLEGRGTMAGEWTIRRPDGSQAFVLAGPGHLVTAGGQKLRVSTIIDVTARRQAERALAEATAAKERFVGAMNQQIRRPLSAILGLCDRMLSDAAQGDLLPRHEAMVRDLRGAGRHALDMVEEALDHARLSEGLYVPVRRWTGLQGLVDAALRLACDSLDDAGVALRLEGGPDLPLHVDPAAMRQALLNMLRVAAQRLPAGSELTLRWRLDGAMIVIELAGATAPIVVPLHRRGNSTAAPSAFGLDVAAGILRAHGATLTEPDRLLLEARLPLPAGITG